MCADEGGEEGEHVEGATSDEVVPIRSLLVAVRRDNSRRRDVPGG